MKLAYARLITEDLPSLIAFYEELLGVGSQNFGNPGKFAAFPLESTTHWLFSRAAVEEAHGGDWIGGQNRSIVLEFEVADVDQERKRIAPLVSRWLQESKTCRGVTDP